MGLNISLLVSQLQKFIRYLTVHEQNAYQDVYNRFQPSHEERRFYAANFIDYLQERKSNKGLYFGTQTVEDGSFKYAFWLLTDSLERWEENSGTNTLVFDTSHRTNKYTLKFAAFGTIDKHGKKL